jgi:hypothetical protein
LDDKQATLQIGTTRVFTFMDGTTIDIRIHERRNECVLVSYDKVQKLMRKTRRSGVRKAELYVINVTALRQLRNSRQSFTLQKSLLQINVSASKLYYTMSTQNCCSLSHRRISADNGITPLKKLAR